MDRYTFHMLIKRLIAYIINAFHYSIRIMIVIGILILKMIGLTNGAPLILLLIMVLVANYLAVIMSATFICKFFYILFYLERQLTFVDEIILLVIALLRSLFISIYEYRHHGFSKGGKHTGIKVVKTNGESCGFMRLYIRNFALYTGGCGLLFIPCIPFFAQGSQNLIDKVLKVKVINCKANYHSLVYKECKKAYDYIFHNKESL